MSEALTQYECQDVRMVMCSRNFVPILEHNVTWELSNGTRLAIEQEVFQAIRRQVQTTLFPALRPWATSIEIEDVCTKL